MWNQDTGRNIVQTLCLVEDPRAGLVCHYTVMAAMPVSRTLHIVLFTRYTTLRHHSKSRVSYVAIVIPKLLRYGGITMG